MLRLGWTLTAAAALLLGCGREEDRSTGESSEGEALRSGEVRMAVEAQQAIGLRTSPVEKRSLDETLALTGWFVAVPSNEVVIKATTAGFITAAPTTGNDPFPMLGAKVERDKTLAALHVFLSPQEQAQLIALKEDADAAMEQAQVTVRLVGDQLERYRTAKDSINGSRLIELQEMYDKAQAAYREAKDKLPYLPSEPYRTKLGLQPVDLESPISGSITAIHVAAHQFVAAGDPLWTVSDWSQLWLRVPVFEADWPRINDLASAQFSLPGLAATYSAIPVATPQPSDAARRTIDRFYRVDNPTGTWRPGQAVAVALPTKAASDRLVVPFSAVLWDAQGGTWLYLRAGDDEFRRQRVELGRRIGDDVVIERGLSAKNEAVVTGAQSLYGEEFKSALPVDDDD